MNSPGISKIDRNSCGKMITALNMLVIDQAIILKRAERYITLLVKY